MQIIYEDENLHKAKLGKLVIMTPPTDTVTISPFTTSIVLIFSKVPL